MRQGCVFNSQSRVPMLHNDRQHVTTSFGRRPRRSACHCNSREIVDGSSLDKPSAIASLTVTMFRIGQKPRRRCGVKVIRESPGGLRFPLKQFANGGTCSVGP
jgi:hypothetical protein